VREPIPHGTLDMSILQTLRRGEMHGSEMAEAVQRLPAAIAPILQTARPC
jgi:hypothetical protein